MAISENTIKEMHQSRLDDRHKNLDASSEGIRLRESSIATDLYLVSAESLEFAIEEIKRLGVSQDAMFYIPLEQPIRSQKIMLFKYVKPEHLIGEFSQMEIDYLTK